MFTPFVYTGNIGLFRISQRVARQRSYVTSAVYTRYSIYAVARKNQSIPGFPGLWRPCNALNYRVWVNYCQQSTENHNTDDVEHGDVSVGVDDGVWWSRDWQDIGERCRHSHWDHQVQRVNVQ